MLERGFEYFPSPENDNDEERIAYSYLYCVRAVAEWPAFRRDLEEAGAKSSKQCDDIEKNAIEVFREVRDTIRAAIDTDNLGLMSQPCLLDRFAHAHVYLALHADPAAVAGYRSMICGEIESLPPTPRDAEGKIRDLQAGFELAVFEANWNKPGLERPAEVTRKRAHVYQHDGRRDTSLEGRGGRLDPVAQALGLEQAAEVTPLFPKGAPITKLPDWLAILRPFSTIEQAVRRHEIRKLGKSVGLRSPQVRFLERLIFEGAKQEDNPAAWHAIRQSRQGKLLLEVQALLESRDGELFSP